MRGLYQASLLAFGGVKVLRMDELVLSEERPLTPWMLQLDYRRRDMHAPPFDFAKRPEEQDRNTTKGKQLIEALFSHKVSIRFVF